MNEYLNQHSTLFDAELLNTKKIVEIKVDSLTYVIAVEYRMPLLMDSKNCHRTYLLPEFINKPCKPLAILQDGYTLFHGPILY